METLLSDYILAHISPEPDYLKNLDRRANLCLLNGRMASGHLQGRLLKMLVQMLRPKRILELGTFSGYSALCMAEGLETDGVLDTIEVDDELEDFLLRETLPLPGGEKIRLHFGDATEVMQGMIEEVENGNLPLYDLIFMDADKKRYTDYYEPALCLLRPGGYIIADNTLWDGHVVDPAYSRDKQTTGIRLFNDLVAADSRVETVILPVRDGLTLIRKRESAQN